MLFDIGALYGQDLFNKYPLICNIAASCCMIFCCTSFSNMILLSFNRYIYICYKNHYSKLFTKTKTIIYCMITWIYGCAADLPNTLSKETFNLFYYN